MKARLQLALDFLELKRALNTARLAMKAGVDILEAGTPLIKSEGLDSVRALVKEFPNVPIVADLKTMDAGRMEMEAAAKAGAAYATVMASASITTIEECVKAGRNYGIKVAVDLLGIEDFQDLVKKLEDIGVDHLELHTPIDDQMQGLDPFRHLKELRSMTTLPLAIAGGMNSETAGLAVEAGADTVIVGGAITKAVDVTKATKEVRTAMETGKPVKSEYFVRATTEKIPEILRKVSAANISDAMHRRGNIPGIYPQSYTEKIFGKAVTVRTLAGDWAKPVEAIDTAKEGEIIVIDAGGVAPAVWGELASESALQNKLAGTVIYGATRDIKEIRAMGYPVFAKLATPAAGEPKGFGEINVPIRIQGVEIMPGDWIFADGDGVVAIPAREAVNIANRAMGVLEMENRIREEIRQGSTLAQVSELLRWEKKR